MDREAAKKALQSAKATGFFTEMYGDGAAENEKRYEHVLEGFEKSFGGDQVSLLLPQDVPRSAETTQTTIMEKFWPEASTLTVLPARRQTEAMRFTLSVRHTARNSRSISKI